MIKREYIIALNRAVAHKNKILAAEQKSPIKRNGVLNDEKARKLSLSLSRSQFVCEKSQRIPSSSSFGQSIPEACPSRLIKFKNKIINREFVPDINRSFVDVDGNKITDYARFQIKDYSLILELLERKYPKLPSFVAGEMKGYRNNLYVGCVQAACNSDFVFRRKITRILLCTYDPRITSDHIDGWTSVKIKVKQIELDSSKVPPRRKKSFWEMVCCSANDVDIHTEQMRDMIRFVKEGLHSGGVLIVDMDGFTYAPAAASLYLAVVKGISLNLAFNQVKERRMYADPPNDVYELINSRLSAIRGLKPERAPPKQPKRSQMQKEQHINSLAMKETPKCDRTAEQNV